MKLTPDDFGDITAVPGLLDQVTDTVVSMTADGAYDGGTVYDAILQRQPEADVIIPPRSTAVLTETEPLCVTIISER